MFEIKWIYFLFFGDYGNIKRNFVRQNYIQAEEVFAKVKINIFCGIKNESEILFLAENQILYICFIWNYILKPVNWLQSP